MEGSVNDTASEAVLRATQASQVNISGAAQAGRMHIEGVVQAGRVNIEEAVQGGQEAIARAAAEAIHKEMLEAMLPAEFKIFCESYKALVEAFMLLSARVECLEDLLKSRRR